MENWNMAICLFMLAICSIQDIQYKKIKVILPLIGGAAGVILNFSEQKAGLTADCLPGIILLAVSWITRGAVGQGDGLIVASAGLLMGWELTAAALFWAMTGAALLGCVMMACRNWSRKQRVAFVPFLFGAFIGVMLWT